MSLPNEVVVSTSKLTALGDAVRSRFGVSGDLTLDEMTEIVMPSLPSEYQQVDYIEMNGNQYINPNLLLKDILAWEVEIATNATSTLQGFGSTDIPENYQATQALVNNGNYIIRWKNQEKTQAVDTDFHKLYMSPTKLKIDNSETVISSTKSNSDNRFLFFARNQLSTSEVIDKWMGKSKYVKVWHTSGQALLYLPCYRKSDNVIGLYNVIFNEFHTNAGTGSFSCYPSPT